jgi:hypothetical protein
MRQASKRVPESAEKTVRDIRNPIERRNHGSLGIPVNLPLSPPACASLPDFTKLYPRDTGQKTPPPSLPPTGKTA